jgi:hypothetical protein
VPRRAAAMPVRHRGNDRNVGDVVFGDVMRPYSIASG